jgi:putative PIN family toxin of toxin-antitoxin system
MSVLRILIDTNVLISAVLRDRIPETVILFVVSHPEFEWIASRSILAEYREVLARPKFGLPHHLLQRWYDLFDRHITVMEVDITVDFPRDQKDAMFLACALTADADFFVTGDRDFTDAVKVIDTTILSPGMFKRLVIDTWDEQSDA